MIAALLALAISFATGWLLLERAWSERLRTTGGGVLRFAVAGGLGLLVSSLVFFACLAIGIAQRPIVAGIDLALLAGSFAFARHSKTSQENPQAPVAPSRLDWILGGGLAAALAAHAWAWLARVRAEPLGFWDAFAIWNLKARFFSIDGGAHWRRAFSDAVVWSHVDYPLLLPTNVARLWTYAGEPSRAFPALLSATFAVLAIALVFGAVARARGRPLGFAAAFALLATPSLVRQASWQIADIPLGFYFAASLALAIVAGRFARANARLLAVAGLLAGAAAWTKNEGVLFALSAAGAIVVVGPGGDWRERAANARAFACGLALPLFVVAAMKLTLGGEGDIAGEFGAHSLAQFLEWGRHQMVLASFARTLVVLAGAPLLLVLSALAAWSRFGGAWRPSRLLGMGTLVLGLQLAGDYCVYIATQRDLLWHLGTSNLRLFVQLWPSALLLLFSALDDEPRERPDVREGL